MEVSRGVRVQKVGEASWGLDDPDDLFVSSTHDDVDCCFLQTEGRDGVNIVAVNLSPRYLAIVPRGFFFC